MLSAVERLSVARELSSVSAELRTAIIDPVRKVALARKVVSLRALLQGKRVNSITDLDLFAAADSTRILADHLKSLREAEPDERRQAAAYIAILAEKAASSAASQGDDDSKAAAYGVVREARSMAEDPGVELYQANVKERFRQAGTDDVAALLPKIEAANAELDRVRAKDVAAYEERNAAYVTFERDMRDLKDVCDARYQEVRSRTMTAEQYRVFAESYRAAYAKGRDELQARFESRRKELAEALRVAEEAVAAVCDEFKSKLTEASAITAEQANAWAEAQKVEASAKAALKRIGYELPKLRADMAEFYRMTGGRLAKVRIKASRGRASASDIHGYKNRTINMGEGFSKRTLWHELGHHLEADPEVYAASAGFLAARRESKELHTLRKLTGNQRYGAKEVAYRDHWYSPYVGKVYPYSVTEVMSMGMEAFATGSILALVMDKDPEHIRLMTGFIKATPHPMFASVKKVFEQAAEAEEEAEKVVETTSEGAMKQLAEGVEFTGGRPPAEERAHPYTYGSPKTYVGSYHGLQLWKVDKVRDPQTNRQRKGFILAHAEENGTVTTYGGSVVPRISVTTAKAFTLDEAKAVARIWARTAELRALPRDYRQLQQYAAAYAA
jgi:hypothetical protein